MLTVLIAKYLFIAPPAIVLVVLWRMPPGQRRILILRAIIATGLAIVLAKVGGAMYYDPRPFVVQHTMPLFSHVADNGFPSDHTLFGFVCAFLLLPFSLRAAGLVALIAGGVGLARIACLVHSPVDVIASILFAGAASAAAWVAIRQREPRANYTEEE